MIIDVVTGIIHEQNGWETICGIDRSGYAKVLDTNAAEGDNIFCEECFKEKTPKQKCEGVKQKGDER